MTPAWEIALECLRTTKDGAQQVVEESRSANRELSIARVYAEEANELLRRALTELMRHRGDDLTHEVMIDIAAYLNDHDFVSGPEFFHEIDLPVGQYASPTDLSEGNPEK